MARLRLWQPASISGEVSEEPLLYYSYRCTEFRTGQSGEDDFCSVSGQIGNYAGSQRSAKGQMHLSGQPGGSKAIAYGSSEDHTDYGCGIENVEQAVQPFFTTQEGEEHSGMGFTIMQTFMSDFSVISETGKGTTVRMSKQFGARATEDAR